MLIACHCAAVMSNAAQPSPGSSLIAQLVRFECSRPCWPPPHGIPLIIILIINLMLRCCTILIWNPEQLEVPCVWFGDVKGWSQEFRLAGIWKKLTFLTLFLAQYIPYLISISYPLNSCVWFRYLFNTGSNQLTGLQNFQEPKFCFTWDSQIWRGI